MCYTLLMTMPPVFMLLALASSGFAADTRVLPATQVLAADVEPVTIALRYLAFKDPRQGKAVIDESAVARMVSRMNQVWAQCQVSFRLDDYAALDPARYGARFNPANFAELDRLREATRDTRYLTMISTGKWDRSGDLGDSGSNCYSSFPSDSADGIVCEARVAANPLLHAHEAGHWLNLKHTKGRDLMNHFVGATNDVLTHDQCVLARSAIGNWRRSAAL